MRLENKIAIVTGAGQGIGLSIAERLAEEGADVVVNDIEENKAERTADIVRKLGRRSSAIAADMTNYSAVEGMISDVVETYGALHILVNNAGVSRDNLIYKMSEKEWDDVLAVNLKGMFNSISAASKVMIKERYGRIVNIASIYSRGGRGSSNYSASKGGVISLTYSAALDLAEYNITVNCVSPGLINTEMIQKLPDKFKKRIMEKIPLKRAGEPRDVANSVLFLVSEEASYVTGHNLLVDAGLTLGFG